MSGFGPQTQTTAPAVTAVVSYGTYKEEDAGYVGMTVAQIRLARAEAWSIPSDAKAYRMRDEVNETYVVTAGDQIEFHRRQGDKG